MSKTRSASCPSPAASPTRPKLGRFLLWAFVGMVVGLAASSPVGRAVARSRGLPDLAKFDPDVYPPIDIVHTPPMLLRADEEATLSFAFACGYTVGSDRACLPSAELYVTWGPGGDFVATPLVDEDRDTLRILTARVPATNRHGQTLRYYIQVQDVEAGLDLRHPPAGSIEPAIFSEFQRATVTYRAPATIESRIVVPWGEGPNEVGLSEGPEQATVGPDAFDVAPDGTIVLLDEMNSRVLLFEELGASTRAFSVPVRGVGDIDISAGHSISVLDLVGERNGGTGPRIPQLYSIAADGRLIASAQVYALRPLNIFDDGTIFDMADGRKVRPIAQSGQPQSREQQRAARSRPPLLIQWITDYRSRLADPQRGNAFEIESEAPLGPVAFFGSVGPVYVAVFEWTDFQVVWFDESGGILMTSSVPNHRYSVFNPNGRIAVDGAGAVYILGSTEEGIEILRVEGPKEVTQ